MSTHTSLEFRTYVCMQAGSVCIGTCYCGYMCVVFPSGRALISDVDTILITVAQLLEDNLKRSAKKMSVER